MCIVCIANNIIRNVYMYLNSRIFPTTGYGRVLLFMFIRRELGGTSTGCLFQFTYCDAGLYGLRLNHFLLFMFRVCYVFLSVQSCGHLLGKGWPLGSLVLFVYIDLRHMHIQ